MAKYDYVTFKELYDAEISYAYEPQYGVIKNTTTYGNLATEIEYYTFHKLSLFPIGKGEYKGNWFTFDPRLWSKIQNLAESLIETDAEKVLYKASNPNRKLLKARKQKKD